MIKDENNSGSQGVRGGFLSRNRMWLVVCVFAALFAAALFSSFLLSYNFKFVLYPKPAVSYLWLTNLFLPLLVMSIPIKLLVFHFTGQFRGSWRYVGLADVFGVIYASLVASFVFLSSYFVAENVWNNIFNIPLIDRPPGPLLRQSAVFSVDWAATIVFVCAAKVLVRFYYEDVQSSSPVGVKTRVLIVGAGDAGEGLLRELLRSRQDRYEFAGFIDDDVAQLHGRIHGVPVIGRSGDIRKLCEERNVHEVLIARPNLSPRDMREMVEKCEGTGVIFRTIPALTDVAEGRVKVTQFREVDIADLLGREAVVLDTEIIGQQIRGQVALVTGAGGSIGSEMCRQISEFQPRRLVLVERSENALFEIDRELRARYPQLDIEPFVADISDRERLDSLFRYHKPAVVFHAAAHKHVPMMERNAGEAIKNNIVGTSTVADVAIANEVSRMVMISTDKAVNPTSVMGCTKRVAEMYVQGLTHRGQTEFITVRFGNVLGSSGSVVPIFREQILRGGPITVTHPEMVRYFMTIPEAAQLVLQAGAMGKGGEIYVLHMGDPVRIVDLARDMITLSGLRPGVDIDIVFSGTRPGEKLFEELSSEGEHIGDTGHKKIGVWKHRPENFEAVCSGIEKLKKLADAGDFEEIRCVLSTLVPEYDYGKEASLPPAGESAVTPTSVK